MNERKIYVPPGGPPQGPKPNPEIYVIMGEASIYKMIEDFYCELGKSSIGCMFPKDLAQASIRTADFFVFLLGGPPIYHEKHGHPMMRQRHMPFKIDEQARQVWLSCFKEILIDGEMKYNFPMKHFASFWNFLEDFSAWMVNTKE